MLLALLPLALATQVSYEVLPCPLGGEETKVFYKLAANTHGGWDSDLASYSTEGQWREYALATCPNSLLTLYSDDMGKPLDPKLAPAIEKKLAELRKQYKLDADNVETWERYLIAGEMYKILGKDHRFLAQLYLDASWVARDEAVGLYMGLEGPIAARTLLDQGELELKKSLEPRQRKILLHNLARVAHRGGYNADRDRYLSQFEAVGNLDADEKRAIADLKHYGREVEPKLQRLAVTELQAYLATDPADPVELARSTYLLADLARRLGEFQEAARGYALVLTLREAPDELRELSAYLGSSLPAEKK